MIYATCSFEAEEGEQIISGGLGPDLVLDPIGESALPPGVKPHARGWVRVLPGGGRDGFFIARLKRG
jgi:16S rRNA C967 or C1407 C5-methylase (RsmB/RsmF family)